jgi:diguanylate cyclase (GGDEF)-like protein
MIDLATLLLATIATDVVLAATLWIAARRGVRDGMGSWFGSLGVRVAALGMFAGPAGGNDPAIVVVATALLALSLTLQAAALLEFGGRKLAPWVHSAVIAGTAMPFALLSGAPSAQVLFGGLAMGTMLLVIAGVAFQIRAPLSTPTRALMIGAFCLGAAVFYARGVASPWVANAAQGFLDPNVFQSLTFMLAYVSMVAASCGFMLMNKERADAAAERLASLDPLTGAYNRRTFHETAERTLALARRAGQPLSIIMIDIDHFKGVNDQHGHRIGDEVLRVLAEVIRSQLRKEDLLTRFGGEEFCVMLPQVPGPGAVVVAGRIRKAVCAEPIRIDGHEMAVTVSAGVAARLDEGPESLEDLLGRADQALSLAKNRGRNRVVALSLGRSVAA